MLGVHSVTVHSAAEKGPPHESWSKPGEQAVENSQLTVRSPEQWSSHARHRRASRNSMRAISNAINTKQDDANAALPL
jgi:hypothetical protein